MSFDASGKQHVVSLFSKQRHTIKGQHPSNVDFLENSGAMVELSIFLSFPCLSCVGYTLGLGKRDPVVKRRWLYTKSVNHQTGHRVDCRENHMLI